MAARRKQRLDRVVDRTYARRQPQLQRSLQRQFSIINNGYGNQRLAAQPDLFMLVFGGEPGQPGELGRRQRCRDGQVRQQVVRTRFEAASLFGSVRVGQVESRRQREGNCLGRVDRAATAERDQHVWFGFGSGQRRRRNGRRGRVLRDGRELANGSRTKQLYQFATQRRVGRHAPGGDDESTL